MVDRISIVIHALHGGGAERIAADMANFWAAAGVRVQLITLDTVNSDVFRTASSVKRIGLGLMQVSRGPWQALRNNRRRVRVLREALRQGDPQCILSLTDRMNILTLLAARPTTLPVVIAEHSDPRQQHLGFVWEHLRQQAYPRCAAAVVLTNSVAQHLRRLIPTSPIHVIPNAVPPIDFEGIQVESPREKTVLAMGRLSREKGFDLLIRAFGILAHDFPDWHLDILGEGNMRGELEQMVDQARLVNRVRLVGWVDQPAKRLTQAGFFVLSSRYEGFPVSLLEAMACGLPVVSFDCESGPREIVRHDIDGLLVAPGNVDALAGAMQKLMEQEPLRQRLGTSAREVTSRFSQPAFYERWERVLTEVITSRKPDRDEG